MKPMTHAEATSIMAKREALLADDNVEIWVGFDSDGPVIPTHMACIFPRMHPP